MKRLFKIFDNHDAFEWFERHGVRLTTQEDQCVFPVSQDSHTIINCFLDASRKYDIEIRTHQRIQSLDELADFDYIVVTTGGAPRSAQLDWIQHETTETVPSLFTFNIKDTDLHALMGTVVENATVFIPGTKLRASGPLLITHWGMSGPAILRLSSYAARELSSHNYQMPLSVNWISMKETDVMNELNEIIVRNQQKQIGSVRPFNLPSRLWLYLASKCLGERVRYRWKEITQKELNRLTNLIINNQYQIDGRASFKDEFVTCGGISLQAVDNNTLESKSHPGLYFAGEVLDIDGVTGGFNFQAAWTTAYAVAHSISQKIT